MARLTIPDSVLDAYDQCAARQGRTLDEVLTDQLKRFADLPPGERAVVIGGAALITLEQKLGGHLKDGAALVQRVSRLAGISFRKIDCDFTPAQLDELVHRAERQHKTVDALVQEAVAYIVSQLFWQTGGGPAAPSTTPPPARSTPAPRPTNDAVPVVNQRGAG